MWCQRMVYCSPHLSFIFVLAILAELLTLKVAPWANEQEYQLKEKIEADAGLAALRSGRFNKLVMKKR